MPEGGVEQLRQGPESVIVRLWDWVQGQPWSSQILHINPASLQDTRKLWLETLIFFVASFDPDSLQGESFRSYKSFCSTHARVQTVTVNTWQIPSRKNVPLFPFHSHRGLLHLFRRRGRPVLALPVMNRNVDGLMSSWEKLSCQGRKSNFYQGPSFSLAVISNTQQMMDWMMAWCVQWGQGGWNCIVESIHPFWNVFSGDEAPQRHHKDVPECWHNNACSLWSSAVRIEELRTCQRLIEIRQ